MDLAGKLVVIDNPARSAKVGITSTASTNSLACGPETLHSHQHCRLIPTHKLDRSLRRCNDINKSFSDFNGLVR